MPNRLNNVKSVKCLKMCKSEMTRGHTLKTFLKHLSHGLSLHITFSTLTSQHLGSTFIYTKHVFTECFRLQVAVEVLNF